ncbi:MAG: tyrosine-type recombinase/integrase [Rudaea sp.]
MSSLTNITPFPPSAGNPSNTAHSLAPAGISIPRGLEWLAERISAALGHRTKAIHWTMVAFDHVRAHTKGSKGQKDGSAKNREDAVCAFIEFTRKAPWEWTLEHVDKYFKVLSDQGLKLPTRRGRQVHLRVFCNYVIADRTISNGIKRAFGCDVHQIITPLNSILHRNPIESDRHRVNLNYDEVEKVFDALDEAADIAQRAHCRSEHTLLRDKTINSVMYGTGLREESIQRLSLHSFSPNPDREQFGNFGVVNVLGKGDKLNQVTLLDPAVARMLEFYLSDVRSRFLRPGRSPTDEWGDALFLSERGTRIGKKAIYRAALRAGEMAGLAKRLFPHIWRHTYITHSRPLQGPDNTQQQVSHTYSSTTDGYCHRDVENTASIMDSAIQHTIDSAIRKADSDET